MSPSPTLWGMYSAASTVAMSHWAAADNPADPISILYGLGPVGLICALLITGHLRTRGEVTGLEQRIVVKDQIIAQKDAQIQALTQGYVDKAMPTLTRLATVLERIESDRRAQGGPP